MHVLIEPTDAAQVLREARLFQDFNQCEIALAVANSQSAVSDWERGQGIELDSLLRWAAALGYNIALVPMACREDEP